MNKKPLLSICIPTYKRSALLKELLDLILYQLGDDMKDKVEIVISNNPSEGDDTPEVVAPYVKKHDNIHFFRNETNLGFLNIVKVTEYAQWEYIFMLADDDSLADFAIENVIEMIEKTKFDILLHKPFFSEHITISLPGVRNTYTVLAGMKEFITELHKRENQYKHLISYFSFYSSKIVKAEYLHDARNNVDKELLAKNNFPHELVNYYNLKDKVIVMPDSTLVIWRILNESYPWAKILIKDFDEVMDYIEKNNDLSESSDWKEIKKICVDGRTRTINLWIAVKKLGINYKQNRFLKAIYFLYKKFVQ